MEDLTGNKYGRLKVLKYSHNVRSNSFWVCQCECGTIKTIQGTRMKTGVTKSCGCFNIESHTKHGHRRQEGESRTYITWRGMIDRCTNPNADNYNHYGGRGIGVCDKWLTFEGFHEDMGDRPKGTTIERIDNRKGYFFENCIWASKRKQSNNTRRNHYLEYKGERLSMADMARKYNIPYNTLRSRINNYKWDINKAIETPIR